ncbi:hypothetical protein [Cellulomonas palmilytica]|uniref:hypothetical protein n=1 Tax=Cellulomonas palmilytica TaxID=2608402 RepID=UPI001F1E6524|nr:hypothetical protein [Cellulomonas palmilytica]UJP39782.1 hypothetical protein F1D97_16065 [Cellulomonas palmilytica]
MSISTDALWGGRLTAVAFDPVVHELTLQVEVLDEGVTTAYDVVCPGVSDLRFANSIPEPWSYAEVTEIHVTQTTSGRCAVELLLWSEDSELVWTCSSLEVTVRS